MVLTGMSNNAVVVESDDIEKMLEEISAQSSNKYKMEYDGNEPDIVKTVLAFIAKMTGKTAKDLVMDMVGPAEEFYEKLVRLVPQGGILQHRIGLDYTTKIPATLTVISKEHESLLPKIMDMAAVLEISVLNKTGNYCSFWIITDHKLDQYSINHDFPCYKVGI